MKKLSLVLTLVLFALGFAVAQRTVTGTVNDQKGEPMVGASVLVKGTTNGTVTDIDGKFSLNVPADATTLSISFAGYQTQDIALGASNVVDVSLSESTLQEVVVTAIGIQREKKALGYSANDLKSDEIAQKSEGDAVRALASKVPGVNVVGGGGAPGQSTKINIRGFSSLTGNTQPLFVVDGIPFDNSVNPSTGGSGGTQYSNRAFDIDPNNIESMTILKGAAAAALYGSRATNGVVVITTKSGKKNRKGLEVSYNSSYSVENVSSIPDYQDTYTQGSSNNYNGAFIGNWGAPFPNQVDRINQTYYGGETRYSKTYSAGYPEGTARNPITGEGFGVGRGYPAAFPELMEDNPNSPGTKRAQTIQLQPYNFIKEFLQQGNLAENALTINAGGENMGLTATISRMDNNGILPMYNEKALRDGTAGVNDWGSSNWGTAKASRTSMSLGGNAKLANGLMIQSSINYVNTGQVTPPIAPSIFTDYLGTGDGSLFARLYYLPRNFNLIGYPFENPVSGDNVFYRALDNPIWLAKHNKFKDNVNRVYGNITLSYDVTPWLNLTARGGVNTYGQNRSMNNRRGGVFNVEGSTWSDKLTNTEIDINYIATVTKKITEDIDVRWILGFNQNQRELTRQFTSGIGIITNALQALQGTTTQFASEGKRLQRLYAGYTDIQLSYKSFLYLGIVARNDWSSTLPKGKNSYFYPGVNTSFIFSDAFGLANDFFSYGKLRASWTQVGNEATPYRTSTVYNIGTPFVGTSGKVNIATLGNTLGNSELRNELTTELEFGTDIRFFRNRLGIDLTYFTRKSTDQITSRDIPNSSGFNREVVNVGRVDNKGFELGLDVTPIKTKGGFTWNTYVNFSRIRTEIVDIDGDDEKGNGELIIGGATIHREGKPYGQIFSNYGTKNARVDPNDRKSPFLIDRSTGLILSLPNDDIVGDPNPDFILGVRNTISYKGLSLSGLLDYKQGGDIYSATAASLILRGQLKFSEDREGLRVIPGVYGDPQTVEPLKDEKGNLIRNTTPTNAFGYHFSNAFGAYGGDDVNVYDATAIRLREIVLGYEIPKKVLKGTPFGSLKVSLSGRNLFFYAPNLHPDLHLDPEVLPLTAESNVQGYEYGATPTTRRWGVNLAVTF